MHASIQFNALWVVRLYTSRLFWALSAASLGLCVHSATSDLTEGFSIPSVLSTSMSFASTEAIRCAVAKAHTLSMPCCGASLCVAVPTVSPRHSATGLSLRTSAASVRAGVCTNGGELEKKRSRSTHPSSMAQAAIMAVHSLASYNRS